MERKTMTTLHLRKSVRDRFKELVTTQDRTMGDVVEELMRSWVEARSSGARSELVQMNHAASLLTKAVCEHLSQHPEWAMEALIGAGMALPGANVYAHRITHFSEEKQELGKLLAKWLILRSAGYLSEGRRVFLVCDSGTTVFWFLKALGEAIEEHFKPPVKSLKPQDLSVVTNNVPGAESFVTYAALHSLPTGEGRVRMTDLVNCRMLAGSFLPEYVATTGPDTNKDLENFSKLERGRIEPSKNHSSPVFIGIATGNWINIRQREGLTSPFILARGRGHAAFKQKLLDVCDEVFVVGPLGKMLLDISMPDLNGRLHYSETATDPTEQCYEEVEMLRGKAATTRIVSTIRERKSVLHIHSALLVKKLGSFTLLDFTNNKTIDQATAPIGGVNHLLFPFDRFADLTIEAQLEIELPHKRTREDSFKREIFSIHSSN